jgi:hypothetical protein
MGYDNHPLLEAIVDHSAAGDNIIVVGIPGNTIEVYALFFVMGGDAFVTIQSAATPLTGAMDMLDHGSVVLDYNRRPWFVCGDGEDFIINLAPGVSIDGRCYYTQSATDTLTAFTG